MVYKNILSILIIVSTVGAMAQTDSAKSDSLLLLQIQSEMQQQAPAVAAPQQRVAASSNPDISVIGDFRGLYRSFGTHNADAELHEAEFSFQSVVDPYARADFFYSVGEDAKTGKFSGGIEEGYLTTLSLPWHLQLKAGRIKQDVGRVNPVHAHALPFVNMPDAYVAFFGEEGLKGDGLSLSWLLPNRLFFQELTVEASSVDTESPTFERSSTNNYLYLAHLKNFWDLSSNATLELGLTAMQGENLQQKLTDIGAIDVTYKWKPVRFNTYKSVTFQNELYYSQSSFDSISSVAPALSPVTVNAIGFYSLLNVQVAKRFFLAGRYDYTNKPDDASFVRLSGTLTLGWYATEFQKIEIEGKYSAMNEAMAENNFEKSFVQANLRWIFVIGSHGAHQY